MATLIADQGYELVTPTSMYALAAAGVLVGLLVGLGVLRCVLTRLKREELSRRELTLTLTLTLTLKREELSRREG